MVCGASPASGWDLFQELCLPKTIGLFKLYRSDVGEFDRAFELDQSTGRMALIKFGKDRGRSG